MLKSKTNSVTSGKYIFQPTKYDENGNIYCAIYRMNSHGRKICKLTGLYNFEIENFQIEWVADMPEDWLTTKHKKLLEFFLNEYDWVL